MIHNELKSIREKHMLNGIRKVFGRLLRYYYNVKAHISGLFFDWRFNVRTNEPLDRFDLDVTDESKMSAWSYVPCSLSRFTTIMDMLDINPSEYTLVDIGSGKGRVLILAAEMGFKSIIGVEFSMSLHKTALQNIHNYQQLKNQNFSTIQLLNIDAIKFQIPKTNSVLCLFNPFQAPVMEKFLAELQLQIKDRKSPLYILYVHPTEKLLIEKTGIFEIVSVLAGSTDTILYRLKL